MLNVKTLVLRTALDLWQRRRTAGLYTSGHANPDVQTHLAEARDWLCRAQDHGSDEGVSYGAILGEDFLPSYPETTGYIICTFLDLADYYADKAYLARAFAMGVWETRIQMDCGAVMGGMLNSHPTPAVFNTGMVLLGWAALLRTTGDERFRLAGERAGRWLLAMQEPNGQWIRGNSKFANARTTTYNVKAAWGLAEMAVALGNPSFLRAAERNAEFAVSRQTRNGWFRDCCLQDARRPLLHTIAYTMQGLIGIGRITGRNEFVDAAALTARSLLGLMSSDGYLPGKIDSEFQPAADWCCLTGTAQTSIVWSQLAALRGDACFAHAAERANRYLMARHDITNTNPAVRGGVLGSWPVHGAYGRFKVLNWATKFFLDALLIRQPTAHAPRVDLRCE